MATTASAATMTMVSVERERPPFVAGDAAGAP